MNQTCRAFWDTFLKLNSLPSETLPFEVFYFSDNVESADYLANSTLAGFKAGTASLYWDIEFGNSELPKVGDLSMVTFANGEPACVIETLSIEIVPFEEVNEEFAALEDAVNPSLNDWREFHWREFSERGKSLGKTPNASMPVVCEKFKVIHP